MLGHVWSVVLSRILSTAALVFFAFAQMSAFAESRLSNISTRGAVGTDDSVMIGGVIIEGSTAKTVVVRAIGPSLPVDAVAEEDQLQDPYLQIFSGQNQVDYNDNWEEHPDSGQIPEYLRPSEANESAIYMSLEPGAYTAIVTGAMQTTGVALVEIFEIDQTDPSRLINISTRGAVATGDNVMIGGVIIEGDEAATLVFRARGPSLSDADANLTGLLEDPQLQIFSGQTQIHVNDNWQDHAAASEVPADLQPTVASESAILVSLDPGAYTAIVSGVGETTGIGIVEVFEVAATDTDSDSDTDTDTDSGTDTGTPENPLLTLFAETISEPIVQGNCRSCHGLGGLASGSSLIFERDTNPDYLTLNLAVFETFIDNNADNAASTLRKAQGDLNHGGTWRVTPFAAALLDDSAISPNDPEFESLQTFLCTIVKFTGCP